MRKPIMIRVYDSGNSIRNTLKSLGVQFTERDIFCTFWGKEFTIQYPTGKGATAKVKTILSCTKM